MSIPAVLAAFLRRDFRINISYRASFGLEVVSSVFALALFFYLSRVVDVSKFPASKGLSGGYFGYATVGLLVLTIVQAALASFAIKLREEQATGTFEALMATPVGPSVIALSSGAYDLLRATFSGLLLLVVAIVVFGLQLDVGPGSIGVALLALLGNLGLLASLGIAVASFTVVFKRGTALLGMVVTGLSLLSGVYFPIQILPTPIEQVAAALPFTWGLDLLRAALLGGNVDPLQLAGIFASTTVLLPIALLAFTAAVNRARATGTLAQY